MSAETATTQAPRISQGILTTLVRRELERKPQQFLLVHASSAGLFGTAGGAIQFAVTANRVRHQIVVEHCDSVLALTDAWNEFQREGSRTPDGTPRVLVITTPLPDAEIGLSLLAFAARQRTITVNPAELVREQFGVRDLDWRLAKDEWLINALLAAEPQGGWAGRMPTTGPLLTRDSAVTALLAVRIGLGTGADRDGGVPDAGALLDWSRAGTGPARFAALPEAERDGIVGWLTETTGVVAAIVLRLASIGRAEDAVPLGLLCSVIGGDTSGASDALLLLGALFGPGGPSVASLAVFAAAAEGLVQRWTAAAAGAGQSARDHRDRVLDVVARAESLAVGYPQLIQAFTASRTLPSGFTARLSALCDALLVAQTSQGRSADLADAAFTSLKEHRLAPLYGERTAVAEMALRVVRWLCTSTAQTQVGTVPELLSRHLAELGWVDRALNTLHYGDPEPGPNNIANERIAAAFRRIHELAQAERAEYDRRFAVALRPWAARETQFGRDAALLIEDVLGKVAVPLAKATGASPLILVLDGMSSAVATEFGERLSRRNVWTEVTTSMSPTSPMSPTVRLAAAAVIPSVTSFSRTSLLAGHLAQGGQREEKEGFAAFWRERSGLSAALFHKREIGDELAGGRLNPVLTESLAGTGVVGVVLNDVDDALDKGGRGDRTRWDLSNVTHFESLLDMARNYGRPIVLVSDHGHVLDRSTTQDLPTKTSSMQKSQRYRSADGEAVAPGEVLLSGPRVADCGGTLIAAWAEQLRYAGRRAGYHGGASLAEMTVPVLVFLPAGQDTPKGWSVLSPRQTAPAWWTTAAGSATEGAEAPGTTEEEPRSRARRGAKPTQEEVLFSVEDVSQPATIPTTAAPVPTTGSTLGTRVVASETYRSQSQFVRKMKESDVVATIDALHAGDRTLPAAVLAQIVGRTGTAFDGFVANLERLLNIDQYQVISRIDAGRTLLLDIQLLCEQFGLDQP